VADRYLRFDFTHFSALDRRELREVEHLVNEKIRENLEVKVEEMDYETALRSGAVAIFEEKYGDRVRVVSAGGFSRELCGGTHVRRTGDIGYFKIISESSVGAGMRRIVAQSGRWAVESSLQEHFLLEDASASLNVKISVRSCFAVSLKQRSEARLWESSTSTGAGLRTSVRRS